MPELDSNGVVQRRTDSRATALYEEHRQSVYRQTDRLFASLMILQYIAGIAAAFWISPRTWIGATSQVHLHVWVAVVFGAAVVSLPVFLAFNRPGAALTRHVIAVGQMLMGAMFIDLTGGRIETHFHVFGSLAFLAFYRDWHVLISASAVVALDHFIRGVWWPESVYGVLSASPWRWAEHAGWVIFEDVFLIHACLRSLQEMRVIAQRQAELEATNTVIESTVIERTAELHKAMRDLDAANAAKSEFLANMSHEIRTPMTAILGYADIMVDPRQGASDRLECIETIRRNGAHLLSIINDILDISKIEAGKLTVEHIECSPAEILADVASLMRGRALEKGLQFHIEYAGPIPRTILTDPTRLRQILLNLCGNGVKFTKEGRVRVVCKMAPAAHARQPRLCFEVHDTGIGLTATQQAQLFIPFTQGDSSTSRQYGGTGLGLTISRRLAEMLGGGIAVQSIPDHGSIFTLEVQTGPLEGVEMIEGGKEAEFIRHDSQATSTDQAKSNICLKGVRVLLAEDGPDNQRLIAFHLRKAGAKIALAENGRIAYEAALAAARAGTPFDIILMDMQMPEIDGYSATAYLRSKQYAGTIIALTAHAMTGDRERCLRCGCNDYATKPINRVALLETVRRWVPATSIGAAQTSDSSAPGAASAA